ncbi:hypothetical protein C8R47DRAFT_1165261, partial [Mycena vitilis]
PQLFTSVLAFCPRSSGGPLSQKSSSLPCISFTNFLANMMRARVDQSSGSKGHIQAHCPFPAAMRIFEQQTQAPTCQPLFVPEVDHDRHSNGAHTQYYVVNAGFVPNIYTDSMAADNQIRGFTNYERKAFTTKADALRCWEDFCRRNHGTPCPNAVRTFWGIKGIRAIYQSRAAALEVADAMGLMSINLFGSQDKEDVAGFVGL